MLWRQHNHPHEQKPLSVSQLQEILDEFDYPWGQFTIESFIAWIGRRKGRAVDIMPFTAEPEVFGAWVGTPTTEYFCYGEDIEGTARTFVLAHEVSHWILLHSTKRLTQDDIADLLGGGDLDLNVLQIVQQRSARSAGG